LLLAIALPALGQQPPPQPLPPEDRGAELHEAARRGDLATVRTLLDAGVPVDAKSEYGATALSFACDKGHTEVVKLLLERGADVNVADSFYEATPVVWAASNGHAEVVKLLVAAGVDPAGAIGMAVQRDNVEVVRAVLDSGKVKPESLSGTLAAAKAAGKTEVVTLLEAAGVKPPPPATAKVDPAVLAGYAGRYENDQFHLTISVADGNLQVSFMGQPPMALGAVDATHFRLLVYEAVSVEFKSDGGKVTEVEIDQAGSKTTAKRVEAQPEASPPANP
jgi:hypothetical protein